MAMKRRGFTLIEIIIYCGLSAVALGIITSIFALAHRTQRQTYSQYLVGGSLASTIRLLRRELQATALASITVPQTGEPGMSCASAYDNEGQFSLNGYGAPHWQKYVFYTQHEGSLIRWTKDVEKDTLLPTPTDTSPSAVEGGSGRSVMTGLLPPDKAVKPFHEANRFGGFEVSFVRREGGKDSLTQVNPKDDDSYETHTRLVEVTLRTYEDRSDPDYSEITFRVCPRY